MSVIAVAAAAAAFVLVAYQLARILVRFHKVRRNVKTVWTYETGRLRARRAALRVAFQERRRGYRPRTRPNGPGDVSVTGP